MERASSRPLGSRSSQRSAWPLCGGCLDVAARGDVLRPYSLGPDAYAAGQHRGVDVAGSTRRARARSGVGHRLVRRCRPDLGPHRDDPARRVRGLPDPPRRDLGREGDDASPRVTPSGSPGRAARPEWSSPYVHLGHPGVGGGRRLRRPAHPPAAAGGRSAAAAAATSPRSGARAGAGSGHRRSSPGTAGPTTAGGGPVRRADREQLPRAGPRRIRRRSVRRSAADGAPAPRRRSRRPRIHRLQRAAARERPASARRRRAPGARRLSSALPRSPMLRRSGDRVAARRLPSACGPLRQRRHRVAVRRSGRGAGCRSAALDAALAADPVVRAAVSPPGRPRTGSAGRAQRARRRCMHDGRARVDARRPPHLGRGRAAAAVAAASIADAARGHGRRGRGGSALVRPSRRSSRAGALRRGFGSAGVAAGAPP